MPSLLELARSSGLIFTGTVVERGNSRVPSLPASPELMVVRVDRGLRVDPVHGDLRGRLVTVVPLSPEQLAPGQQAVFFTNSWIQGQGIAAREVAHMDAAEEAAVVQVVDELPRAHLLERLEAAHLVAHGRVVHVSAVERTSLARNDALWAVAELALLKVLRGTAGDTAMLYFPTSDHPMWANAPRFKQRQRGVFILHTPDRDNFSQVGLPADGLVALDPADVQPESQLSEIEELLGTIT